MMEKTTYNKIFYIRKHRFHFRLYIENMKKKIIIIKTILLDQDKKTF